MLTIDGVRQIIELQKLNEISFSKMVELLNEKSFEWIDVSKELPNENEAVLCVDEFGYMQVSGYAVFWYSKLTGEKLSNGKITHWGYLPLEPKKGSQPGIKNLNNKKMKVFKFYCGELYYAYAALTKEEAIEQFKEETGDQYTVCEEIPEREWDKKMISIWEDNNFDKKPYKISIREAICGTDSQMIFSNDTASM